MEIFVATAGVFLILGFIGYKIYKSNKKPPSSGGSGGSGGRPDPRVQKK